MLPKGFDGLVKLAMKERPPKAQSIEALWDAFLDVLFMGGRRSEGDIRLLVNMLRGRKLLDLQLLLKTPGEDWREAVEALVNERLQRIQDEETRAMLRSFKAEIFRITASVKGSARFFRSLPPAVFEQLDDKEQTQQFIESLVSNEDVPNVRYTKVILWLHAIGYAEDFCPPSWQVKKFVNEVGPYYQFYEDDKYFMEKAQDAAADVRKRVKGATARDVSVAIYCYMTLKTALPPRSASKKKCTPAAVVAFLRKRKLSIKILSEQLADEEQRDALLGDFVKHVMK
ncbi:MAG: hypothetical protein HYY37_05485 [Candidatus Aenigmarchaeota archaeon]|nr:hypothetical protein [Candidatus Aenigmarchaeota archaeon]